MTKAIYQIEGLTCGYNSDQIVLRVPNLEILSGRIYVVLGKSGSGKSTLLETLALMNNTMKSGKILFAPSSLNGKAPAEINTLWDRRDNGQLDHIRSRHFSFIFQQTNLMPNFSVYENIYISRLIQGAAESDCHEATREILDRLGMSFVDAQRKVTELSGGQRQRVAFARAAIASYDVLFGDEPTGNLDVVTSIDLLDALRENVKRNQDNQSRTALIVSHSIDLALRFADHIIVITKYNEYEPGEILKENCFERSDESEPNSQMWKGTDEILTTDAMKKHLQTLFDKRL